MQLPKISILGAASTFRLVYQNKPLDSHEEAKIPRSIAYHNKFHPEIPFPSIKKEKKREKAATAEQNLKCEHHRSLCKAGQ